MQRQDQLKYCERRKPVLDDQEMQLIEGALLESFNQHCKVDLALFDTNEDRHITGIVTTINRYTRDIKLSIAADEWEWIKITDIIAARL
ncbi:YolD-like family protein [Paenibacillus polygoni]|uniref:YolD-like family protein n=1 Tax=Paenibacillus polygoni TaxID=3050112 RepID=A0ABY8X7M6_9BACL|nr:YolD-like family protein [Paenibacillus polygoni]